jgi:hypothetical protein
MEGYVGARRLDDVWWLVLMPLTFGRLRVVKATKDTLGEHW